MYLFSKEVHLVKKYMTHLISERLVQIGSLAVE